MSDVASFSQNALLFLETLRPATPTYHMNVVATFERATAPGPHDIAAAIAATFRDSPELSQTFRRLAGGLTPRPAGASITVAVEDDATTTETTDAFADRPFTWSGDILGPFVRARVLVSDAHVRVQWVVHHVVADFTSVEILTAAVLRHFAPDLPPLHRRARPTCPPIDEMARAAVREQFGAWPSALPLGPANPAAPTTGRARWVEQDLPAAFFAAAQARGQTGFEAFYALTQSYLMKRSGDDRVLVATPVSRRGRASLHHLGPWTATLPLPLRARFDESFSKIAARVRPTLRALPKNVTLGDIIETLGAARDAERPEAIQFLASWDRLRGLQRRYPAPGLIDLRVEQRGAAAELCFVALDEGQRVRLRIGAAADRFSPDQLTAMGHEVSAFAEALARDGDVAMERVGGIATAYVSGPLPAASPPELSAMLHAASSATPDAAACCMGETTLTYAALDAQVERVATHLFYAGVRPGERVALALGHPREQLVSILACIRLGAAFVPLAPNTPRKQNAALWRRLDVVAAITQIDHVAALPNAPLIWLHLDDVLHPDAPAPGPARRWPALDPKMGAYVYLTSGTTGAPQGVALSRGALAQTLDALAERFGTDADTRFLASAPLHFDIALAERLLPLIAGGQVVFPEAERSEDPPDSNDNVSSRTPRADPPPLRLSLTFFGLDDARTEAFDLPDIVDACAASDGRLHRVFFPERHGHRFGGLFPAPEVAAAAVVARTRHLEVAAGSIVMPRHAPEDVAEAWSMIARLGRRPVALALAAGWNPRDLGARGPASLDERAAYVEALRTAWPAAFPKTADAPRLMLTTTGKAATVELAARLGCDVYTHLWGQDDRALGALAASTRGRAQWSVMVHAAVDRSERTRAQLRRYLEASADLMLGGRLSADIQRARIDETLASILRRGLFGDKAEWTTRLEALAALGASEVVLLCDWHDREEGERAIAQAHDLAARFRHVARTPPQRAEKSPLRVFADTIKQHRVTHVQFTPTMLAPLLRTHPDALGWVSTVVIGGERVPPPLLQGVRDAGSARVVLAYGPTESCIWSSTNAPLPGDPHPTALGAPLRGEAFSVLSPQRRVVGRGVPGELYIHGGALAEGYVGDPARTADRFTSWGGPPGSASTTERGYLSGDAACMMRNADIVFLGRRDRQRKVRGRRIELDAVEHALERIAGVERAVADADATALSAGLVLHQGTSLDDVRDALRASTGAPLRPDTLYVLDAPAATTRGKLDRGKLPVGHGAPSEISSDEAERLVAIVKDVLGVAVDLDTNFFRVGGTSIQAVEVLALAEAEGIVIPQDRMLTAPTLRALLAGVPGGAS